MLLQRNIDANNEFFSMELSDAQIDKISGGGPVLSDAAAVATIVGVVLSTLIGLTEIALQIIPLFKKLPLGS